MHDDTIGNGNGRQVRGKVGRFHLHGLGVDDAIAHRILLRCLTPLRPIEIEGVAYDAEIADRCIEALRHLHITMTVGPQAIEA